MIRPRALSVAPLGKQRPRGSGTGGSGVPAAAAGGTGAVGRTAGGGGGACFWGGTAPFGVWAPQVGSGGHCPGGAQSREGGSPLGGCTTPFAGVYGGALPRVGVHPGGYYLILGGKLPHLGVHGGGVDSCWGAPWGGLLSHLGGSCPMLKCAFVGGIAPFWRGHVVRESPRYFGDPHAGDPHAGGPVAAVWPRGGPGRGGGAGRGGPVGPR